MNAQARAVTPLGDPRGARPRRRRRLRWLTAGLVVAVVLLAGGVAAFVEQPAPAPLRLPAGAAARPSGPLGGTWQVAAGSVAGFRIRESALGFGNDVVGRTSAVTGTIALAGDTVTRARLTVGLADIRVDGKTEEQLARSLATARYPDATFTLSRPVQLSPAFAAGATIRLAAPGVLSLRGLALPVTVILAGRRSGAALQVAGSIQVAFARWRIASPGGLGFLGSLADQGIAEFLIILRR